LFHWPKMLFNSTRSYFFFLSCTFNITLIGWPYSGYLELIVDSVTCYYTHSQHLHVWYTHNTEQYSRPLCILLLYSYVHFLLQDNYVIHLFARNKLFVEEKCLDTIYCWQLCFGFIHCLILCIQPTYTSGWHFSGVKCKDHNVLH